MVILNQAGDSVTSFVRCRCIGIRQHVVNDLLKLVLVADNFHGQVVAPGYLEFNTPLLSLLIEWHEDLVDDFFQVEHGFIGGNRFISN